MKSGISTVRLRIRFPAQGPSPLQKTVIIIHEKALKNNQFSIYQPEVYMQNPAKKNVIYTGQWPLPGKGVTEDGAVPVFS
jgi:hypothetical protein